MARTKAIDLELFIRWALCCATLVAFAAQPAVADWLITLDGKLIETRGAWSIDGKNLTYKDSAGVERTLSTDDVDLEASEETTAIKAGRAYVPSPKPVQSAKAAPAPAKAKAGEEPKITLYMTSWCGYCRKATKLLKQLDADFEAKDIEKNREAANEFRRKSGGRGGVPLIDVDGKLVRGYNEQLIRKLVAELEAK